MIPKSEILELPLVGAADHLEEEFRAELAGGDVSQLVEDQQVELRQRRLHPQQRPFFPSFHELRDEFGHATEADAFSSLTRGNAEGRRWMLKPQPCRSRSV
ncbi:MAG: hypothetical protein U0939_09320 [Pirellulales bacterium]